MDEHELDVRRWIAHTIIFADPPEESGYAYVEPTAEEVTTGEPPAERGPRGLPRIDWSLAGRPELEPEAVPLPEPRDHDPLPEADVVVMTWTSAEWDALHYVFTNELGPLPQDPGDNATWRATWRPYRRDFYLAFQPLWARRLISAASNTSLGAPSLSRGNVRWGSYAMASVGSKRVLLFKSELHLNQDGESLPLRQLVRQIVEETKPELLLSVGTAGGVETTQVLGDAIVANSAMFRLGQEFESASFNGRTYRSSWEPPIGLIEGANRLLAPVGEFDVLPPTSSFPNGTVLKATQDRPSIKVSNKPILTTDFFEFGTTHNGLDEIGCAVEMGDAVIAMEGQALGMPYGFVRNVSDPVITGDLAPPLQVAWAVVTYQRLGLLTSFNSAIGTWAMIAGTL